MNANPKFLNADARIDDAATGSLPNSRKVFVEGTQQGVRVPMREITQADTAASFGKEKNPSIFVYDTSGPYTDPECSIDIRRGLPALRGNWIDRRSRGPAQTRPQLLRRLAHVQAANSDRFVEALHHPAAGRLEHTPFC